LRALRALICPIAIVAACSKRPAPSSEPPAADSSPNEAQTSSPEQSSKSSSIDGSGPASGLSPASVELLEPGRAPRRKLRYHWRLQQKEWLTINLSTALSTRLGDAGEEVQLPGVRIVVALTPTRISERGDLEYGWRVQSAQVQTDNTMPAQLVDGMRIEVAGVQGLSGSAVVTTRGLTDRISFDEVPGGEAGATGQMVDQVVQTLADAVAPFPEEEVGAGARWQKVAQLATRDAAITQSETFTLRASGGDKGELAELLAQTAPPQALRAPGIGPIQARMESMLASGDATVRYDLSRLIAHSKFRGTTTMVVAGEGPRDALRRTTMVLRVQMDVAGQLL
jgi:hypothetical protein